MRTRTLIALTIAATVASGCGRRTATTSTGSQQTTRSTIPEGDPERTSDPVAVAAMLRDDYRRQAAAQRLVNLLEAALADSAPPAPAESAGYVAMHHGDPRAPGVRRVVDAATTALVEAVELHPRDVVLLSSVTEFFAKAREPGGLAVLRAALASNMSGEVADAAATRAAEVLHDPVFVAMIPANEHAAIVSTLRDRAERALPRGTEITYSRAHVYRALGTLGVREAVPTLVATLGRPADPREPDVWSACVDALGMIGDPRSVGPLLRALYLDRSEAADLGARTHVALVRTASPEVTRRLLALTRGEGPDADAITREFFPSESSPRLALARRATEALGAIAPDEAAEPLLAALAEANPEPRLRVAVIDPLVAIAFARPARRDAIVNGLRNAIVDRPRDPLVGGGPALGLRAAIALTRLDDASVFERLLAIARGEIDPRSQLQPLEAAALVARHDNAAVLDTALGRPRMGTVRDASAPSASEPLQGVVAAATLARTCDDDDLACTTRGLADPRESAAIHRAAITLAWRTPPQGPQRDAARRALLDALPRLDSPARGVVLDALDALWGDACRECSDRMTALASDYEDRLMRPRAHIELLLHLARHGDHTSE